MSETNSVILAVKGAVQVFISTEAAARLLQAPPCYTATFLREPRRDKSHSGSGEGLQTRDSRRGVFSWSMPLDFSSLDLAAVFWDI